MICSSVNLPVFMSVILPGVGVPYSLQTGMAVRECRSEGGPNSIQPIYAVEACNWSRMAGVRVIHDAMHAPIKKRK